MLTINNTTATLAATALVAAGFFAGVFFIDHIDRWNAKRIAKRAATKPWPIDPAGYVNRRYNDKKTDDADSHLTLSPHNEIHGKDTTP